MQNPWLQEPDAIFSTSSQRYVVRIETHHSMLFVSSPLPSPVYVLSFPCKTCSPMVSIEQWYSRRSTAPKIHTVKRALHTPLTDRHSTGW
ncbi:hypothetical protein TNCV_438181 [Trichonephila clavipes]|nr:hypothetical protein TNCV_438181 [Trichonephila clavipes]